MTSHLGQLGLLLAILACTPLCAATYYVAPTGSDNVPNDGSAALPFREIRRALTGIKPGDTVLVADAHYKGFNVDTLNGNAANPITIQAQGTGAIIDVTTDRSDNRDTIFVTFSTYIVIDGLRSSNANRAAVRVDQSQHITVRNGNFGNNATWGIFTDFADDLLLENNECYGSVDQHGIYVSNSCTRPIVRGNKLHDNHDNGLHMNGDLSQGPPGVITNALVENNVIYNNGLGGGSGINCDGVQNSVIRNNLIYAAHGAGITLYQTDAAGPSINATVINNTIDVASDGKWALQIHNGSSGAIVFNNIFLTHHSFHGSIHLTVPADQQGLLCDYNILTTNNNVATPDDDGTELTFAQWQALGYDTHSVRATQAACFLNSAGADYHLSTSSPALDKAIAAFNGKNAPPTDLEGTLRPQGPGYDIGAYELVTGGPPPSVKITSGPSAAPNPALVNQTVTFSVSATSNVGPPINYAWDFGDGAMGSGTNPLHTYTAAGTYPVSVTASVGAVSDHGSVSVTITGSAPLVGMGVDSDGDGYSDSFETAVATDPNSAASTPTGQPVTVATLFPLTISKASIKLNFASANKDAISFSGTVALPFGFNPSGTKAYFDIGGVAKVLTLSSKGSAVSSGDSFKLRLSNKGSGTQTAKYSVTFNKGSFAATLANSNLTNADAKATPVSVIFTLIVNNTVLQKAQSLHYSAKMNKSGTAK